jgi:hypothetical protein
MLRSLFALLLLCCSALAVSGTYQNNAQSTTNYFPQHVGDEHVYRKTGRLAGENAGWTDTITEKVGPTFLHTNFFGDGAQRALRTNKKGNVVEKNKGSRFVWYKFSNPAAQEWIMQLAVDQPACVNNAKVRIASRNETVTVPAGTFTNVIRLEFSTNCNDAGIIEQWFAPNVGLIKQTEDTIGGPIYSELVSAKVGKQVYPQK